jgi:hypothetical protein
VIQSTGHFDSQGSCHSPSIPPFPSPVKAKRLKSASDNARYLGTVKVEYLFHPLFGQEVRAVQCDAKGRKGQLLVETAKERQCLPAWMTDPRRCALLTFGWQPFVSDQALRELDALLAALDQRDPSAKLDF